ALSRPGRVVSRLVVEELSLVDDAVDRRDRPARGEERVQPQPAAFRELLHGGAMVRLVPLVRQTVRAALHRPARPVQLEEALHREAGLLRRARNLDRDPGLPEEPLLAPAQVLAPTQA